MFECMMLECDIKIWLRLELGYNEDIFRIEFLWQVQIEIVLGSSQDGLSYTKFCVAYDTVNTRWQIQEPDKS